MRRRLRQQQRLADQSRQLPLPVGGGAEAVVVP